MESRRSGVCCARTSPLQKCRSCSARPLPGRSRVRPINLPSLASAWYRAPVAVRLVGRPRALAPPGGLPALHRSARGGPAAWPDDVEHLAVIDDNLRWRPAGGPYMDRRRPRMMKPTQTVPDQRLLRENDEQVLQADFQQLATVGRHLEHLLRRRSLNPQEADCIAGQVLTRLAISSIGPDPDKMREAGRQEIFWRVYPLFPKLDPHVANGAIREMVQRCTGRLISTGSTPPLRQYLVWTESAVQFLVMSRLARTSPPAPRDGPKTRRPEDAGRSLPVSDGGRRADGSADCHGDSQRTQSARRGSTARLSMAAWRSGSFGPSTSG